MITDVERISQQAARPAIIRLWEALLPLKSVVSFMNSGAHPDDETTALLAVLARRDGVRVSYVCANRGEGGQNAIGTEAQSDLGAIRSREMEEAARILDFDLYWLSEIPDDPIFDFGFSKSAEETFSVWGVERTLERLVRVIRTERPDILCPTFLDVPGQHGHHRAMTRAAARAVGLAADEDAFPDQIQAGLNAWQVSKLYLPAWSGAGDSYDDTEPKPNSTFTVEAGDQDPVFGATYAQMAQWSRLLHRTQGMGRWVDPGPKPLPLHRQFAVSGLPETETTILDGLPRTVGDLAERCGNPTAAAALSTAQRHIDEAFARFPNTDEVLREVVAALQQVRLANASLSETEPSGASETVTHRLALKERQLSRAAAVAAGLQTRLTFTPAVLALGDQTTAGLSVSFGNADLAGSATLDLQTPSNWQVDTRQQTRTHHGTEATFALTAPEDAPPFEPYRTSFSTLTPNTEVFGTVAWRAFDVDVETAVEPETPVALLPPVGLTPRPAALLHNLAAPSPHISIVVEARRWAGTGRETSVALRVPGGWQVEPEDNILDLDRQGATAETHFTVTPGPDVKASRFEIPVGATGALAGRDSIASFNHPHIGRAFAIRPASVTVRTAHVALPEGTRIGYVEGGADEVPARLEQIGLDVTKLDTAMLAHGDLSAFDTIVVGIFAYRTRPDLAVANDRIKQFVHAGGHLLTLYHRPMDNWDPATTPPRRLKIGTPSLRWRVTDQNAPVKHLLPDHPLLNRPNRIGDADWEDWHKERGLYFASEWDPVYEPLLEMADPDEAPLLGALVSGRIGLGRHTHTSLILHHQMEQLVPGAYRLFANLVAPARDG